MVDGGKIFFVPLKGLSSEMDLAESGINRWVCLKGIGAEIFQRILPLNSQVRPFKFLHHLVRPLGIDNIIAISDRNIHSAISNLTWKRTGIRTRTRPRTMTRTRTRTQTRTRTRTRTWNWNTFVRYTYGAKSHIAPYGLPVTHHGASSNGAKNL